MPYCDEWSLKWTSKMVPQIDVCYASPLIWVQFLIVSGVNRLNKVVLWCLSMHNGIPAQTHTVSFPLSHSPTLSLSHSLALLLSLLLLYPHPCQHCDLCEYGGKPSREMESGAGGNVNRGQMLILFKAFINRPHLVLDNWETRRLKSELLYFPDRCLGQRHVPGVKGNLPIF